MKYVCLSIGGFYVRDARPQLLGPQVDVRGTGVGAATILRRTELGDNIVTLSLVSDGSFLTARSNYAVEWGPDGPEARWLEVWWPDDRISLRAAHGSFLCAERGGGDTIIANRGQAGAWEKFFFEQPPAALVPREEPESRSNTLGKRNLSPNTFGKRKKLPDVTDAVNQAEPNRSWIRPDDP